MKLTSGEKYLLDTNILVYSVDRNSRLYKPAREVIEEALQEGNSLVLAHQNLVEFITVLTRGYRTPYRQVLRDVKAFASSFELIAPLPPTLSVSMNLVEKTKGKLYPFDLYLAATMLTNNVSRIITENKKDFQGVGLQEIVEIS